MSKKLSNYPIDVDYINSDNRAVIRITAFGDPPFSFDSSFFPYFYVKGPDKIIPILKRLKTEKKGELIEVKDVQKVQSKLFGKSISLLKVICNHPSHIKHIRELIPPEFKVYENRILFGKRYIIDKQISLNSENGKGECYFEPKDLRTLAFDIETYNPQGIPRKEKDPIIMISVSTSTGVKKVFTYKEINKDFVEVCKDEAHMISSFFEFIKSFDPDVLFGFNSANFDVPYIQARARKNKVKATWGKQEFAENIQIRNRGLINSAKIFGRIHFDLYPILRFLGNIGALKVSKFNLKDAYFQLTGKQAKRVKGLEIWKIWDNEGAELDNLSEYSLMDAIETLELSNYIFPLALELSNTTKLPIFDISNSTSGQMVEFILMFNAKKYGEIIPKKPSEYEVKNRLNNPIEGAFVKLPRPGIYNNIVVFDFRGLYPSIICSHNIDPSSLLDESEQCEDCFISPQGHKFKKQPIGLIPKVLGEIVDTRSKLKSELKKIKDKELYKKMFSRVQALKILANSFYGYLAFARSRWYSRPCAESVTAWGRYYIKRTIEQAENHGFEVLYGDTDSVFLLMGDKPKKLALEFLDKINSELPGNMELELEGFYPRGVFVSKKTDKSNKGAKKKYALIDESGKVKIRGFELVRRDWSNVAKKTQKQVLMAILKEGSKEKAIKIVRDVLSDLKKGNYDLKDLIITTKLKKNPKDYDIKSPELSAAKRAISAGIQLDEGSIVEYVICKEGKSISEKAYPYELAKLKKLDYDVDYYINHQVLPAVLKILSELGYTKEDIKIGGKQNTLDSFF